MLIRPYKREVVYSFNHRTVGINLLKKRMVMKIIIYTLLVCFLLLSCKKEKSGKVVYQLQFTSEKQAADYKSLKLTKSNSFYTQFGDYITSITPIDLSTSFNFLFAQSTKYVVNFVGNNWEGNNNPELNVNFSKNQEVTVEAALMINSEQNGLNTWIGCQDYDDNEATFTYFCFIAKYFNQEFELPVGYSNIELEQLDRTRYFNSDTPERNGNIIKALTKAPTSCLTQPFNSEWHGLRYNFGIYNPAAHSFIVNDNSTVIDGSFDPITLTMPLDGETKVLYSTVNFDTENLIQLYAGADNIPYTSDDVIVYAPDYWKRVQVKIEIK